MARMLRRRFQKKGAEQDYHTKGRHCKFILNGQVLAMQFYRSHETTAIFLN
ncbi:MULTISPECIES: hypothetical protein [unclassified Siphonobacter]|uniref:hypothetical protein n=1 Tax=unclassified Siphonobacter TaxID=2635712 RepID=UPI001304E2F9|nr:MULTISPECIES: hypothetical protein [unclassified Siphonobacter]